MNLKTKLNSRRYHQLCHTDFRLVEIFLYCPISVKKRSFSKLLMFVKQKNTVLIFIDINSTKT